jgi:hypothetical protein
MRYLSACGAINTDIRRHKAGQTVLSDSASTPQIGNIPTDATDVAIRVAWQ